MVKHNLSQMHHLIHIVFRKTQAELLRERICYLF